MRQHLKLVAEKWAAFFVDGSNLFNQYNIYSLSALSIFWDDPLLLILPVSLIVQIGEGINQFP
jgi:hypothetical protein